mmetsp:Transcript_18000/g.49671  ORF Transcript_18000/g.49671 Transcript_18000/m.49671 type:complete len:299 (+) Transcript_18000:458-1354(+)
MSRGRPSGDGVVAGLGSARSGRTGLGGDGLDRLLLLRLLLGTGRASHRCRPAGALGGLHWPLLLFALLHLLVHTKVWHHKRLAILRLYGRHGLPTQQPLQPLLFGVVWQWWPEGALEPLLLRVVRPRTRRARRRGQGVALSVCRDRALVPLRQRGCYIIRMDTLVQVQAVTDTWNPFVMTTRPPIVPDPHLVLAHVSHCSRPPSVLMLEAQPRAHLELLGLRNTRGWRVPSWQQRPQLVTGLQVHVEGPVPHRLLPIFLGASTLGACQLLDRPCIRPPLQQLRTGWPCTRDPGAISSS